MIRNRPTRSSVVWIAMASLLITTNIPGSVASTGTKIVIGLTQEPQSFDPAQNLGGIINGPLHTLVYEGLVSVNVSGKIFPVLATKWSRSSDDKVYTFTIRKNVKFHDGSSLDAADVVYSLKRSMTGAPQVAQRFASVSSVEPGKGNTVVITLKAPSKVFIFTLADPTVVGTAVVPSGYSAEQIAKRPIGTGPFKFTSYSPGSELVLSTFDNYWSSTLKPEIDTISFQIIPQESSLLSAFLANQVDLITLSSIPNLKVLEQRSTKTTRITSIPGFGFWLNLSRKGLTRPDAVAKAVALSLDRAKLNAVVFSGTALPFSTANPVVSYALPLSQLPNYTRDVAKAKSLLASAGHVNGITLNFIYPNRAPFTAAIFEVIKSSLAEAGITANIQPLEPAVWLPRFINADYDISMTDQAWYSNPERYVIPRSGWQAPPSEILPELTGLLTQFAAASDKERPELFQKIQILEAEAAYPFIGLVWTKSYLAYNRSKFSINDTSDRITGSWKKLIFSTSSSTTASK